MRYIHTFSTKIKKIFFDMKLLSVLLSVKGTPSFPRLKKKVFKIEQTNKINFHKIS